MEYSSVSKLQLSNLFRRVHTLSVPHSRFKINKRYGRHHLALCSFSGILNALTRTHLQITIFRRNSWYFRVQWYLSRPGSKVPSVRYICYGYSHVGAARAFTNVQNAARVNAFDERSERCAIAVHDSSDCAARTRCVSMRIPQSQTSIACARPSNPHAIRYDRCASRRGAHAHACPACRVRHRPRARVLRGSMEHTCCHIRVPRQLGAADSYTGVWCEACERLVAACHGGFRNSDRHHRVAALLSSCGRAPPTVVFLHSREQHIQNGRLHTLICANDV